MRWSVSCGRCDRASSPTDALGWRPAYHRREGRGLQACRASRRLSTAIDEPFQVCVEALDEFLPPADVRIDGESVVYLLANLDSIYYVLLDFHLTAGMLCTRLARFGLPCRRSADRCAMHHLRHGVGGPPWASHASRAFLSAAACAGTRHRAVTELSPRRTVVECILPLYINMEHLWTTEIALRGSALRQCAWPRPG
jgi:hypothetical protein